ncbi:MAG: DUF192 domain-containing protein [Alphaproteobacteria bacterium]
MTRLFAFLFLLSAPLLSASELKISQNGTEHLFNVDVANTPDQLQKGLMGRKKLADDRGMLFLFPRPHKVRMWMYKTPLSLDMLFINKENQIIFIKHSARPKSRDIVESPEVVKAVLEIKGGTSKKLGIQKGATVSHSLLAPCDDTKKDPEDSDK